MVAAYEVIRDEQLETVGENQVRLITEAMGPSNDQITGKGSSLQAVLDNEIYRTRGKSFFSSKGNS